MSVLLLLALHPSTQGIPEPPRPPLRALVAAGGGDVDGEWVRAELERILEAEAGFDVTTTVDPGRVFATREALFPFQLFVLDYAGPRFGEPAERNLLDAVRGGKGLLGVHAAEQAFRGWIGYEELFGLCFRDRSRRDPFRPLDVQIVDREHPITRGLPDLRAHPDALFQRLVPMHGVEVRVLARAWSAPDGGGSGRLEPALVVRDHGLGRVVHTPLGHVARGQQSTRASLQDPSFEALLRRAAEWAATGDVRDGSARANRLEPWDARAGWTLPFDGREIGPLSPSGPGWAAEAGALRRGPDAGGAALVTERAYGDFELELEWMAAGGARAQILYRGQEPEAALAYVLADDAAASLPGNAAAAGALDGLVPRAAGTTPARPARWHRARIVADGPRVEHWLDGARVVSANLDALGGAGLEASPIAFGGGDGEVWLRSLRLRDRGALPGREVEVFDGQALAGWRSVGDARWTARRGLIEGELDAAGRGFLVREAVDADFFLELEVRIEGGNSGVQVRSREDGGKLFGLQLEVDPSPRRWSGGVSDEGRRGWVQTLQHHPLGRAAFDPAGWNHYRIECVGPSIRCWVGGVQTADLVDEAESSGHLALEVQGEARTKVAFRALRLWVLED